jgi:type 1 fimbriae regulatory protein FimB
MSNMDGTPLSILPKTRMYLTPDEVGKLIEGAGRGRNAKRTCCLILLMFRHGLRLGEALELKVSHLDLEGRVIHIQRLKNGVSGSHPLESDELRLIQGWLKERGKLMARLSPSDVSDTFFCSPRGGKLDYSSINRYFAKLGKEAGLSFHVHPHMLRHSCGYALANLGNDTRLIQSYLGHRTIQQTVRYTDVNPMRFGTIWGRKTRWAA